MLRYQCICFRAFWDKHSAGRMDAHASCYANMEVEHEHSAEGRSHVHVRCWYFVSIYDLRIGGPMWPAASQTHGLVTNVSRRTTV